MDNANVILIVDDNPVERELLRGLLAPLAGRIELAPDGTMALAAAAAQPPDLVLLDVMMPAPDGYEVCRRMRQDSALADVPILMITSLEDRKACLAGLEAGADDWLTIPFDAEALLAKVRTILRLNRHRRLSLEKGRFERLVELSPNGILIVDTDGRIRFCNSAYLKMLQLDAAAKVMDRPLYDFIEADHVAACRLCFDRLCRDPRQTERIELSFIQQGGRAIPVEIDAGLLPWDGHDMIQIIARDLSERRALENQLLQAQKLEIIGRLAGGVAHDFNNLLSVINGYSELVLAELPLESPLRETMTDIRKAGERAAGLTHQLLAFSRKQIMKMQVINLTDIVREMEKLLRRLIGEDIELTTTFEPRPCLVKADPQQLGQVIMNLAVNARDAMPHGGRLMIEIATVELDAATTGNHPEISPGRYIMLAISDTGIGMTDEIKTHIFEPFFTTKKEGKGTGLGLSTVYGIIKQSGGHILVYSEPAHGTAFKIYFPCVAETADGNASESVARATARGTETVLLVEDDEGVRKVIGGVLRASGYRVLEAADGDEALAWCEPRHGPIHLVVTDLIMPLMSGRQLSEILAGLRPDLKILFISGYPDHSVVERGMVSARDHFLQKPFTPEQLARKVREILDGNP